MMVHLFFKLLAFLVIVECIMLRGLPLIASSIGYLNKILKNVFSF